MTKYLLIALFIAGLAIAGLTRLWLDARDDLAVKEVELVMQRAETEKAITEIRSIKAQHIVQNQVAALHLDKQRILNDGFRRKIKKIENSAETSKAAAVKEPARYGRIATYTDRRMYREICRASGGSPTDCKISIPKPAKAPKRPPKPANVGNND
tara:strand:- start:426 stop:890 length:465 start_codon:yes stop_codon:yes gene_type:complete